MTKPGRFGRKLRDLLHPPYLITAAAIVIGMSIFLAMFVGSLHEVLHHTGILPELSDAARSRSGAYFVAGALMAAALITGAAWLGSVRHREMAALSARDAELARMSWRLDFAMAASEIGLWDVNLKTDELMWDERARTLFGAPERDGFFSEADWVGVLHPEDRERAIAAADRAVAEDGRFISDYRVVLPNGQVRHIRDMAAVYRGEDGSHRLVGLVWDVTADVARQEELELRRAEAEAATVAKSQFLATMSHEIRTPMTGVLGMLDLLLGDTLSEKQRERATIARASARGLLRILNDVLDLSKLEAQQIAIHPEPIAPREVIGEVMDLMAAGAEQKGLSLTCEISAAVPDRIVTDPMRLRQILTNIVSNATKFTESGGVRVGVGFEAASLGGELQVEVQDSGIGISPEFCDRIFDKFVQADTSLSRRSGGTGLGLAISRQLVELLGGRIALQSVPGEGSTFSFAIPVGACAAAVPVPDGPEAAQAKRIAPLRVLLAEDNATNQYLVRAYLEAAGHAVTTVRNGVEAVAAVQELAFDVVLMDVQMPQMDGPSATRAIRALPTGMAHVPIIALTANALAEDRETYFAAGMTDYVSKPICPAALNGALERVAAACAASMPREALSAQAPSDLVGPVASLRPAESERPAGVMGG